jgi:hypothetical protein
LEERGYLSRPAEGGAKPVAESGPLAVGRHRHQPHEPRPPRRRVDASLLVRCEQTEPPSDRLSPPHTYGHPICSAAARTTRAAYALAQLWQVTWVVDVVRMAAVRARAVMTVVTRMLPVAGRMRRWWRHRPSSPVRPRRLRERDDADPDLTAGGQPAVIGQHLDAETYDLDSGTRAVVERDTHADLPPIRERHRSATDGRQDQRRTRQSHLPADVDRGRAGRL